MNIPTDSDQIKNFLKTAATLSYSELQTVPDLDKALSAVKYLFVLYEYKPNYGHWTVLLKTKDNSGRNVVEFFDPYGAKPDRQQAGFSKSIKNKYGMSYPLVVKLLNESKYPIEYNNHKLQKYDKNIQTCGRWCMMRCLYSDLSIDQFKNLFTNKKIGKDELVTLASNLMMGS